MKSFLKYVLATITGLFILFGIFFLIILSFAGGISKEKEVKIENNSVLVVSLNYSLPERTDNNPFEVFAAGLSGGEMSRPLGMYDVIRCIESAKTDDKIKGIFLDLTFVDAGYARLTEIRDALEDFKSEGKFIYAYGEVMYNQTYYMASVADSIFLNPKGSMLFNGMSAEVMFLKETLAKLGIEMQVIKHGKFKGAVEPFTREELSEANRLQIEEYINSLFDQYLTTVGNSRGLTVDQLKAMADSLTVTNPKEAHSAGLIDELAYRDQVIDRLKSRMKIEDEDEIEYVKLAKYFNTMKPKDGGSDNRIAVIYANGDIVSGNGEQGEIGSDRFLKALRKARKDENVKAVVLRVNSPGGSALASEVIWREAVLTKEVKPLIVSMGDVAASGGYYISCMADTIVAMPNTITGSIGVFGMYPNAEGMYDKLGFKSEYVKTSKYADFGRIDRPLNEGEKAMLTQFVEEIYTDFVEHVSEGRGLTTDFIDSVAQGRVWTGTMAKENGLVDVHGGLKTALEIAAFKAGLEDYELDAYPHVKDPFKDFMESFGMASVKEKMIKTELGENYSIYQKLKRLQSMTGIQAVMPFVIDSH